MSTDGIPMGDRFAMASLARAAGDQSVRSGS
jgi:hypothetical protein